MKTDVVDLDKIWSKVPGNIPRHGWRLVSTRDFGNFFKPNGKHDPSKGRLCTLCGTRTRYAHILGHTDWPDKIAVGHQCAWYAGCIDKEDLDRAYKEDQALRAGTSEPEYTWEELIMIQMQVLERLEELELASLIAEQDREKREELREEREFEERQDAHHQVYNLVKEISLMSFSWAAFKERIIDDLEVMNVDWCHQTNWTLTSNNINRKRHVQTEFFEAGITVFRKPQGWKCVVNGPMSITAWGRHYHRMDVEAYSEAYTLLRSGLVSKMNQNEHTPRGDSFRRECLQNYIKANTPHRYDARVKYDLQQKGIKI